MRPHPSSTSSSEATSSAAVLAGPHAAVPGSGAAGSTLLTLPRPTPAAVIAVVTFLAFGAFPGYVGGWSYGAAPCRFHDHLLGTILAGNAAANTPRQASVVLLGDSLMELGVLPDELAADLHMKPGDVHNLALAGAKVWDVEYLAERLDPPNTSGPKLAVVGVDRAWFDTTESPLSNYARYRRLALPEARERAGMWVR